MYSQAILFSVLVALAEARFGQEQVPIAAIAASSGGNGGDAATLAGSAVSTLLGGANPCDKLTKADEIVATLGDGGLEAAKGLVAAEQNFNPFAATQPTLCSDASLPVTEALRGIIPLVDPAVDGAAAQNAASAASLNTPLAADGLSVADVTAASGFTNFLTKDAAGAAGAAPAAGNANAGNANAGNANAGNANGGNAADACAGGAVPTTLATVAVPAATAAAGNNNAGNNAGNNNAGNNNAGNNNGNANAGAAGAADFGTCVPTMKFEGGLGGRPATEFTFIPTDPVVAEGQQEALNPNIITNRICDQLGNVCGASAAGITLCESAQAQILALGTRDQTTADEWNSLLGF